MRQILPVLMKHLDLQRTVILSYWLNNIKLNGWIIIEDIHIIDNWFAINYILSKNIDILIADTAGRLHTQGNLMQELEKIKRVLKKHNENAPHETMLVIDGGSGQNAVNQAIEFNKAIKLSGISITKLDGTAKGGVLFAISDELNLPIRYIGVGEGINDLKPFNANEFVDALFSE